jgi:hypothetical protein
MHPTWCTVGCWFTLAHLMPSNGVNLYLVPDQDMDRKFFTANEVWHQEAPFSPLLEGEGPSSLLGAFLDFGVLNVVHMFVRMFSMCSPSCSQLYCTLC